MSKTRDTGFLGNVIKVDNGGNVSLVSGSTTLLSVSSSGAVTITGTISGSTAESAVSSSYALTASYSSNAELLDGMDSTMFAFTSSFNTTSASLDAGLKNVIARTGSFATTGSNVFYGNQTVSASMFVSGSVTATGQIVAQTINVQSVTSSVVYSSGSNVFGNKISDTQQMTGSLLVSGSMVMIGNACVASLALSGDINNTNASVFDINSAPSVASVLRLQRSGGTGGIEIYQGNTTTRNILIANTGELCLGTSICSPRGTFSCCLGVGIATPGYTLDVVCNGTTTNCLVNVLKISHVTSATAASGLGAGILFTVQRPSSNLNINRAAIYGISGTDADDDGDLAFYTLSNTGATGFNQKMRITSDGYVAVTGNQANVCVPYLQGMSLGWNRSNGQGESMINWTNAGGGTACDLVFNFRDSSTLYERLRLSAAGTLYFGIGASSYDQVSLCYSGYNGGSPLVTLMPTTVPGSGALTTQLLLKSNGLGLASGCNHMGLNVQSATYLATCNGAVGIGTITTGAILTICNPAQSSTSTVTWQNGGRIKGNLYSDTGGIAIYTGEEFNSAAMYMVGNDQIQFRICGSTPKLLLTNVGCVACFAGTVCAPTLIASSGIRLGGYAFQFTAAKNFNENTSDVEFFKIAMGGGQAAIFVNFSSVNSGTAAYRMQTYHGLLSNNWTGWMGCGIEVTSNPSCRANFAASSINSVATYTGCLVFRVSTTNNGTSTQATGTAYILVVTDGTVPTFTQL